MSEAPDSGALEDLPPAPDLPDQPGPPASIALEPTGLKLLPGKSGSLRAQLLDAQGRPTSAADLVVWTSQDEQIAVVDAPGDVLALSPGTTIITATLGELSASAEVEVSPPEVARLTLVPGTVQLTAGMRFSLLATLLDAQDRMLPALYYTLEWTSDSPQIAAVAASGEVVALAPGVATIRLTVGALSAQSEVTVLAGEPVEVDSLTLTGLTEPTLVPGESLTLVATARDRAGAIVPNVPITWSSDLPAIAAIDAAGVVRALGEGEVVLTASAPGGASATARLGVTLDADSVVAGAQHACALVDGRAFCWGQNTRGQLGLGRSSAQEPPTRAVSQRRFTALAAGAAHTCGLDTTGRVLCWGRGDRGQLGQGSAADANAAQDTGLTSVTALCAGEAHTCAIGASSQIYCWGDNSALQLGLAGGQRDAPARVEMDHQWSAITCGRAHTCATLRTGEVYCWGENTSGQLGDQGRASRSKPLPIAGSYQLAQLSAGRDHTCGLTMSGTPLCWGANSVGQLGDGTTLDRTAPTFTAAPATPPSVIASGASHGCALGPGTAVYCWGSASAGQLGGVAATSTPTLVSAAPPALGLGAGGDTTYVIDASGDVWGWGAAGAGQLGAGQPASSAQPVRIFGP
jgi:alpha-tubulin suppressor-like RCC1 family protein/uncharacterized protein YjdB